MMKHTVFTCKNCDHKTPDFICDCPCHPTQDEECEISFNLEDKTFDMKRIEPSKQ